MENKCQDCGMESPYELEACEGALAEERAQNVNLTIKGTQHLMSCNCCDSCRMKCLNSWHDENPN